MNNKIGLSGILLLVISCFTVVAQPPGAVMRSPDYLLGKWSFKYLGRISPLGDAMQQGRVVFTARDCIDCPAGVALLDVAVTFQNSAGAGTASAVVRFDQSTRLMRIDSVGDKSTPGLLQAGTGNWDAPVSIGFVSDQVTVNGHYYSLRRFISIVSDDSFTIYDELSEDAGPYVRLGTAICLRDRSSHH
jgi:hypothetical protein